jgi:hypothetical protein
LTILITLGEETSYEAPHCWLLIPEFDC